MITQRTYHRLVVLLFFAWLFVEVQAKGGGKGGGGGGGSSGGKSKSYGGSGSGSKSKGTTTSSASDAWRYYFLPGNWKVYTGKDRNNRDIRQALSYRRIHGILAALAFVVLFPVGGVIVRVVPKRFAGVVHGIWQGAALLVWLAAAGLGIAVVDMVKISGGGLLKHPSTNYHPIIGLVLLALLVLQPIFGIVHHVMFKSTPKRQAFSYLHLFIGRVGITLGIVNGYIGLYISNASGTIKKVYLVVGIVMWVIWMAVAVWSEIRKSKEAKKGTYQAVAKGGAGEEAHMMGYTGYK